MNAQFYKVIVKRDCIYYARLRIKSTKRRYSSRVSMQSDDMISDKIVEIKVTDQIQVTQSGNCQAQQNIMKRKDKAVSERLKQF